MSLLSNLKNTHRKEPKLKRVGRGLGSNWGKTAGRGQKGAKARSGYKRRYGQEGGQLPIYRKIPYRGFSNAQFKKEVVSFNLSLLNEYFSDGDVVNRDSLVAKGFIANTSKAQIKILAHGKLEKKLEIHVNAYSKKAEEELKKQNITYSVVK